MPWKKFLAYIANDEIKSLMDVGYKISDQSIGYILKGIGNVIPFPDERSKVKIACISFLTARVLSPSE